MKPGEKGDLIIRRANVGHGNVSNVHKRFGLSQDINWGYTGTGPHDLALNVLFHFSDQNEAFARAFAGDFVEDVVQYLEQVPQRITGEFLKSWVAERMALAPQTPMTCGELCPSHLAWDNDKKLVIAPMEIA